MCMSSWLCVYAFVRDRSLEATMTFLLGYIGIYLSAAYLRHDAGHDIENQHIVLTSLLFLT